MNPILRQYRSEQRRKHLFRQMLAVLLETYNYAHITVTSTDGTAEFWEVFGEQQ